MKRSLWVIAFLVACSSAGPKPEGDSAAPAPAAQETFPPRGLVDLRSSPPPAEGTLYQMQLSYDGRAEVKPDDALIDESQSSDERVVLELDYRALPVRNAPEGQRAETLVLDALRRFLQSAPPPLQRHLEVGDDRVRSQTNDEIEIDLRGAQPKGDITPRTLLNKPFALLVTDPAANPLSVTLRGIPSVKKLLAALPLRESLAYVQVARPDGPVSAGATWRAKRYFASPIGRLGIPADVEYRLVGFEELEGVRCAHLSLRATEDRTDVKSELGFSFDTARYEVGGDAWIALDGGEVQILRLEDIVAVSYKRTAGGSPARIRTRYETRLSLRRLSVATTSKTAWADGTKRFADVK